MRYGGKGLHIVSPCDQPIDELDFLFGDLAPAYHFNHEGTDVAVLLQSIGEPVTNGKIGLLHPPSTAKRGRQKPIRVHDGQLERDYPAHRIADDVCFVDLEMVEETNDIF